MDQRHGLSLGIERVGNQLLTTMKATGKLQHEDYEVITPMSSATRLPLNRHVQLENNRNAGCEAPD